jgi:hypothetical protein
MCHKLQEEEKATEEEKKQWKLYIIRGGRGKVKKVQVNGMFCITYIFVFLRKI